MSVNRAILVGNAGRDAELRRLGNGDAVATFSVATSETWKDKATGARKEAVEWHTVVIFNQQIATIAEQYVKKGTKVSVEGAIKTRTYEDRDGVSRRVTEIVIGRFDGRLGLEGSSQERAYDEHGYGKTRSRDATPKTDEAPMRDVIDDDNPF